MTAAPKKRRKKPVCTVPKALRALLVQVSELRPDPRNARTHSDRNIEAIVSSYRRFGQQKPIVIARGGIVVAGNGQLAAARRLGWTHIAAISTNLAGADRKAYALADNRTAELAGWDDDMLATLLEELQEEDDTLLEAAGFADDIAAILAPPAPPPGIDTIPSPPDKATTKPGDLLILGRHRLLCGDAGNAEDVDRLLGGAKIHLVHTEPPYNVKVEPRSNNAIAAGLSSFGKAGNSDPGRDAHRNPSTRTPTTAKMRPKDRPLQGDFESDAAFRHTLLVWFDQLARVLAPGRAFYIWGGYANVANYPDALAASGLYFSQTIIWVKEHPVLTRKDYMGNHEWCFYGWREGAAHWFASGLHNAPDVWELAHATGEQKCPALGDGLVVETEAGDAFTIVPKIPKRKTRRIKVGEGQAAAFHLDGPTDLWRVRKIPPTQMVHLTEKPVELTLRAMHYSSRRGENVLDLFGGSGSTLMAAQAAGRKAYLMELDPLYCDVIVTRWENFTGEKAERHAEKKTD